MKLNSLGVYEHMKKNQLNDVTDFGTKGFSVALEGESPIFALYFPLTKYKRQTRTQSVHLGQFWNEDSKQKNYEPRLQF
jgi:hypothetical protein